MRKIMRVRRTPVLMAVAALSLVGLVGTAYAALQGNENAKKQQVLIGADDDQIGDPTIQPVPSPPGPDQSLKKSDQLLGGLGPDTIIGRLGSDVIKAGAGDDVLVGGTEGGQPAPALPNSDIAYGEAGSDAFIWAPGDGSDAFVGGDRAKVKKVKGKAKASAKGKGKGKKKKKKIKPKPEADTLVIGNLVLTSDLSQPQLFGTKFGQLPTVFSSDRGVPTPLGGTPPRNPNLTGLCEIVAAPPGLGFNYLVRFFGSPGNLAVTIRVKGVEQVICPTENSDAATLTSLGPRGSGPVQTVTMDFTAPVGSKLAAFVK
jgi:RTX calcium-binding nonapeptide repeat (4 copies)